jgi:kynurenine formamidase
MRRQKRYISMAICSGALVAAVWLVASAPAISAQTQPVSDPNNLSVDVFDKMMTELSNWGRWGKDDQKGAVNLITPAKRKQALSTVKDGISVSMARTAEMEPAIDNPAPVVLGRPARGGGAARGAAPGREGAAPPAAPPNPVPNPISGANDTLFIQYHGFVHTHMDTFCHRAYKGLMYNGMPMTSVTDAGCTMGSILNFKDGIVTRGVLMDIPRLKGVDYLEPGTRIMPEDLDAWVKKANLKIQPGDVVLIRTGRWARRDAKGPWNTAQLAGLYITCARWLHQHDAAILGSDAAEDVHPSGVDQIAEPIHALVLVAMGMPIFDNLDLEAVSKEAARLNRWEFLVTAAPGAVPRATGSILNPIATF